MTSYSDVFVYVQLIVTARDYYNTLMSSTATVTILVTDRNDNSPFFTFPTLNNCTVRVSNALPIGYVITNVTAHDVDAGENQRLTYAMLSDEEDADGLFSIDTVYGFIFVVESLSPFIYRRFTLSVVASDHGKPPKSTVAEMYIVVNRTVPFNGLNNVRSSVRDSINFSSFSATSPLFFIALAVGAGCCLVVVTIIVALLVLRRKEGRRRASTFNGRMQGALSALVTTNKTNTGGLSSTEATPIKGDIMSYNGDIIMYTTTPDDDVMYTSTHRDDVMYTSTPGDDTHQLQVRTFFVYLVIISFFLLCNKVLKCL